MGRAFSPPEPGVRGPGASPQAGMECALGADGWAKRRCGGGIKADSSASLRNDKKDTEGEGLHPTHRGETAMDGAPGDLWLIEDRLKICGW